MSSKDLSSVVPILDGTNYRLWAIQMGNYLRAKGLWMYVRGHIPHPANAAPGGTAAAPTPPDADAVAEAQEKQIAWDTKDDEANSFIML